MAKQLKETGAEATVKDYRREIDGKSNPGYGKELTVKYDYDYEELESTEEVAQKFAPADLIKLANSRLKSTANSGARQKAVNAYAMSGDDAAREEMIKNYIALRKVTREVAEQHVDMLLKA